jgi:dimethylhistidine N-methyltransferase
MSRTAYFDLLPEQAPMRDEVLAGLAATPRRIAPKYFYDARGCELFDAICRLPEYYPTRTELAIMAAQAPAMAAVLGAGCALIEIGCGNSEKSRRLLDALRPSTFIAVDIAAEQLKASCDALSQAFPQMTTTALRADFEHVVAIPAGILPAHARRVLYFPGSTIGNFTPAAARDFLAQWAPLLGRGGCALIGVDLKKDPSRLHAAYNDAAGVTAAFNLNLLARFNRELGAGFDVPAFRHKAFYNAAAGRIEMHLESLRAQTVTIGAQRFGFAAGETVLTEISCKYSNDEFRALARDAGYAPAAVWSDAEHLFAVHLLRLPG